MEVECNASADAGSSAYQYPGQYSGHDQGPIRYTLYMLPALSFEVWDYYKKIYIEITQSVKTERLRTSKIHYPMIPELVYY